MATLTYKRRCKAITQDDCASDKKWCCPIGDDDETIILEEALKYCKGDLSTATKKISTDFSKLSLRPSARKKVTRKKLSCGLVDQLQKAATKDEASKIVEDVLKGYKEKTIAQLKAKQELEQNATESREKFNQNALLKKGMRVLYPKFLQLNQVLQKTQDDNNSSCKRLEDLSKEIGYYKLLATSLENKLECIERQTSKTMH